MELILKTMTIQEAAALWSDPLRAHLGKWEREFNQRLELLHAGHILTYQAERHKEVDASVVNLEVDALRVDCKKKPDRLLGQARRVVLSFHKQRRSQSLAGFRRGFFGAS